MESSPESHAGADSMGAKTRTEAAPPAVEPRIGADDAIAETSLEHLPKSRIPSVTSDADTESRPDSGATSPVPAPVPATGDRSKARLVDAKHPAATKTLEHARPIPSAHVASQPPTPAAIAPVPAAAPAPAPQAAPATVLGLPAAGAGDVDPTRPLGPAATALLSAAGYAPDGAPLASTTGSEHGASAPHGGPFSHDVVVAVALAHAGQIERLCAQALALGTQVGQLGRENKVLAGVVEQLREASRKRQDAAAGRLQGVKEELKRARAECAALRLELGGAKEEAQRATREAKQAGTALRDARDETRAARAAAISAIDRANAVSARLRGGAEGGGVGASGMGAIGGGSFEDVTAKLAEYSLGHPLPEGGRGGSGGAENFEVHSPPRGSGGGSGGGSTGVDAVATPSPRGGPNGGTHAPAQGQPVVSAADSPAVAEMQRLGLRPMTRLPDGTLHQPSLDEDLERLKSIGFGMEDAVRMAEGLSRKQQERRRQQQAVGDDWDVGVQPPTLPSATDAGTGVDRGGGSGVDRGGGSQYGQAYRDGAVGSLGSSNGTAGAVGEHRQQSSAQGTPGAQGTMSAAAGVPDDLLQQYPAAAALIARADRAAVRSREEERAGEEGGAAGGTGGRRGQRQGQGDGSPRGGEQSRTGERAGSPGTGSGGPSGIGIGIHDHEYQPADGPGASHGSAVARRNPGTPSRRVPAAPIVGSPPPSQAAAYPPYARSSGFQGARLQGLGNTGPPALYDGQRRKAGYTPYKGKVGAVSGAGGRSAKKGGGRRGGAESLLKQRLLGRSQGGAKTPGGKDRGGAGGGGERSSQVRSGASLAQSARTPGRPRLPGGRSRMGAGTPGNRQRGTPGTRSRGAVSSQGMAGGGSGSFLGSSGSAGAGDMPGMPAPPSLSDFAGAESRALARLSGMRSGGAGVRPARIAGRR